jgi:hypothetical protein
VGVFFGNSEHPGPFAGDWEYIRDDPEYYDYSDGTVGTVKITDPQWADRHFQYTRLPSAVTEGHFSITGEADNECFDYVAIRVSHNADPNGRSNWYLTQAEPGTRKWGQEIYLRHGSGTYTVMVLRLSEITVDLKGKGAVTRWSGYYYNTDLFQVQNLKNGASESDWTRLPSDEVQINNEIIGLSDEICEGLSDPREKIKAINKWIVLNLTYDTNVWTEATGAIPGARKKQDALHVLNKKTGICEGYANLSAALIRAAGIPTRYVESGAQSHAWIQAYLDGSWEMIDTTWNDYALADAINWNKYRQYTERYLFLPDNTGLGGDHRGGAWTNSRQVGNSLERYNYVVVERRWELYK